MGNLIGNALIIPAPAWHQGWITSGWMTSALHGISVACAGSRSGPSR